MLLAKLRPSDLKMAFVVIAHDLQTLLTGSTVDPPASPSAEEKLETAAQPIVANGLGLLRDMHVVLSQLFGQVPVQPIA